MKFERGGFALGLVVGLLVGLALALGVALYITKAPVPFMNKVQQRTAEQDSAEAERNRDWDPNAALVGKPAPRPASAAVPAPAGALPQDPLRAAPQAQNLPRAAAGPAASGPAQAPRSTASVSEPFVYFVQVGAYARNEEAEQQRAKLALLGQATKITEREQAGRTVYRVRAGPFPARTEADALQIKLQDQGIEAQIVRVEKS